MGTRSGELTVDDLSIGSRSSNKTRDDKREEKVEQGKEINQHTAFHLQL